MRPFPELHRFGRPRERAAQVNAARLEEPRTERKPLGRVVVPGDRD
jgi:hypothetical protein